MLRAGEHDDQNRLALLPDRDRTQRLQMKPLRLGALHEVIRARLGRSLPRPAVVRVQQVSGGKPFYALEFAHPHAGHHALQLGFTDAKLLHPLSSGGSSRTA